MASHTMSSRRRMRRSPPGMDAKAESWRHDNVGRLLNNAVRRFEARVIDLMAEAGHLGARVSHFSLTRNLGRSGTRLTELAQRSMITKQAMSELVDQCVDLGLVERRPDPEDRRARIVTFTNKGLEWLEDCRRAVALAEHEMREEVGSHKLDVMKGALRQYGISKEMLGRDE